MTLIKVLAMGIVLLGTTFGLSANAADISAKYAQQVNEISYWSTQCGNSEACASEGREHIRQVQAIMRRVQAWADDPKRTDEQYAAILRDGLVVADKIDDWAKRNRIDVSKRPATIVVGTTGSAH